MLFSPTEDGAFEKVEIFENPLFKIILTEYQILYTPSIEKYIRKIKLHLYVQIV